MALINTFPQDSGGSDGHTIQNNSGASMTNRSNLQFTGLSVTDDSANGRTVVDAKNKLNNASVATEESSLVATKAYDTDDLIMVGGVLYKVITPIASGATLIVGTNIELDTLADEMDARDNIPNGGTTGQLLTKKSNADQDFDWEDLGLETIPVMVGATSSMDGERGMPPTPLNTEYDKALFGDGTYKSIYTAPYGSTITVTGTSEFYGQTVTITKGTYTMTATMSNAGKAVFEDVPYFGVIAISATGTGNVAGKAYLNLTYFGAYRVALSTTFTTVNVKGNTKAAGKTAQIFKGSEQVAEVWLNAQGSGVAYLTEAGSYTAKLTERESPTKYLTIKSVGGTETIWFNPVYTWRINRNDSNPATCCTPFLSDYGCDNLEYTSAHMNFSTGTFDWGSWSQDEFFIPKPCMLNYDGTVAYYLNPNDYTKKLDGTASDVGDFSYGGNVMVEFPTVYFKRWEDENYSYCVIADSQLDNDFHAYAHHDVNGDVLDHIYIAAYDGSYDGTRLRSISGKGPSNKTSLTSGYIMNNTTRQQEVNFAKANNANGESGEGWYTWHKAERAMVNGLLILIGMNTNTQTTFGRGRDSGYVSATNTGQVTTGSMNTKGMFWGENAGSAGVKVFGIENWWGNIWKAVAGWINDNGTQKVKMTYGTEDGSTATGFNFDGSGYKSIANATPSGTNSGYINNWHYENQGLIPYIASGSDSTYLTDGLWFINTQIGYADVGGGTSERLRCGACCTAIAYTISTTAFDVGASLSYKSLK